MEQVEPHTRKLLGTLPAAQFKSTSFHFLPGDVLYGRLRPYLNKVWCADREGLCSSEFIVLPPGNDFLPTYLAFYLNYEEFVEFANQLNQGDRPRVSFDQIAGYKVPLPPLAEQRRIVAKVEELLGRVEAARARLARVPAILRRFRQAVLTAACSGELTAEWRESDADNWPVVRWRDVGDCQNGTAFSSKLYCDEGAKLLRPGNLHSSGRVVWTPDNTKRLPTEMLDEKRDYIVGPGELVINLTAQSLRDDFLGRVCMTDPDEQCLLNQRIARLTPRSASPRYCLLLFKCDLFRRYVDSLNTGSLIQHMFTKQVNEFEFPLPPIEEQHEIVRRVDALFALADTVERRVSQATARAERLTQAVLAKAFRGELVPTEAELARAEGRDYEPASALLERVAAEAPDAPPPRRPRTTKRATSR
jgi:type I restriction enzyme S subunit